MDGSLTELQKKYSSSEQKIFFLSYIYILRRLSDMPNARADKIYNDVLKVVEGVLGSTTTYQRDLVTLGKRLFGVKFRGVFAADRIPKMNNGQYSILNLDKASEPGSHWIAVVKSAGDMLVYDSFGRSSKKIIPSVFKSGNGSVIDTEYDIEQADSQLNCGARSITALLVYHIWGREMFLDL